MNESSEVKKIRASTARLQQRKPVIDASVKPKAVNALQSIVEPLEAVTEPGIKTVHKPLANGGMTEASYRLAILMHTREYQQRKKGVTTNE